MVAGDRRVDQDESTAAMNATTAGGTVKEMTGGVAAAVLLSGSAQLLTGPVVAVDSRADFGQHVRMRRLDDGQRLTHPGWHQGRSGDPGHKA